MALQNKVVKNFTANGTWTAPAGVTQIEVQPYSPQFQLASAGWNTSLVDVDGQVYTCGYGATGQLGDGTAVTKSSPVLVAGNRTFVSVCLGSQNLALIDTKGNAWMSGGNANGQLGNGADVTARSSPNLVTGGLKFKKLVVGGDVSREHILGLTWDGNIYAWGFNGSGQLGDGTVTPRSSPVLISGGITDWIDIAAGPNLPAANGGCGFGLRSNGAMYAWGSNQNGDLGDGTVTVRSSPVLVQGSLVFTKISGSMGMTAAGAVYCWGLNAKGGVGDGTTTDRSSPVLVVGSLVATSFAGTAAGSNAQAYTRAILQADGTLYAWGANNAGQIGDGTVVAKSSPVLVAGSKTWKAVYGGIGAETPQAGVLAAVDDVGSLWGWGYNLDGGLTLGDRVTRSSPVLIYGADKTLLPLKNPDQPAITVAVTPGTTYNIVVQNAIPTFNAVPVGLLASGMLLTY